MMPRKATAAKCDVCNGTGVVWALFAGASDEAVPCAACRVPTGYRTSPPGEESLLDVRERELRHAMTELEKARDDRDEWQRLCSEAVALAEAKRAVDAYATHLRPEEEKRELRPRLTVLADKLCQTQAMILGALEDAGLTVVLLRRHDAT